MSRTYNLLIISNKLFRSISKIIVMGDRVKLSSDILRPFTGEGNLVAKLQKIEDIATLIPMYLEGNARAVYLEMGGGPV